MAAHAKLTAADVKRIRRRVRAGETQTDLARQYGVSRKTIRRRLDELEQVETEQAARQLEKRLRLQAAREMRRLVERELAPQVTVRHLASPTRDVHASERAAATNPYYEWLDSPKSLSGSAASEAAGLVRVRLPDGSIRKYVERADVEALLDEWLLDEALSDKSGLPSRSNDS